MQHQPGLPCSIYFAGAPLVESDQRGIEDRSSTRFTVEVSADGVAQVEDFFFWGGGDRFEGLFLGIKNWNSVPTFVVQKAIPCSKWWCFVIFCFSLARGNGVYTGMTLGIGPSAFLFVLHQSGVGIFKTSGLLANCWYKVQIGRYVEIVRNFGV